MHDGHDGGDLERTRASWGPLELLGEVGRGAFGVVWRARDPRLERTVALKLRPASEAASREAVAEGRMLARVRHPNVVTVHGADFHDGLVGIWMEYVEGRTLAAILATDGPFGPREAMAIGLDLCGALAAVHAAGLVHGDVKAQNVVREAGGRIVLTDFSAGHDAAGPGASERVTGTPLYLAPELVRGGRPTARSDLYALGVLLFHLLSRRYPVEGASLADLAAAHRAGRRLALRDVRPEVPAALVAAVARATEADPERRHAGAGELERDLLDALASAPPTPTPRRARAYTARLRGRVLAAAGTLVVVGAAALAWLLLPGASDGFVPVDQRLVSTFPGSHTSPTFSPDGRLIAFVDHDGAAPRVWVKNLDGGDPIPVTPEGESATRPRWSPQNDAIAYTRAEPWPSVWIVPPLGGDPRRILENARNASWSPDGTRLVFERQEPGDRRIFVAAADGTDPRPVEGVPEADLLLCDRSPSFAPDGATIAFFHCPRCPLGDVWTVPAAGGEARRLTFDEQHGGTPVWTPDGRWIVFSSLRAGSRTLWRVSPDGGAPEPVLRGAGEDTEPAIAPDGTRIAYTNTRNRYALVLLDPRRPATRRQRPRRAVRVLRADRAVSARARSL